MSEQEFPRNEEDKQPPPDENQWIEENRRIEESFQDEHEPPPPLEQPREPRLPAERPRPHRSFIFPLFLIALGVLFLLRNVGAITGDMWDLVVRLWPVLLIGIGLDSLFKREGLAGSVFWLALGGVLLLANLGVLAFSVWSVLINLWPLLLIAIGLDLVLGRRSLAGAITASLLMVILVAGSLYFLAFGQEGGAYQDINYPLESANQAQVVLNPSIGSLRLGALNHDGYILQGLVYHTSGETVEPSYSLDGSTAHLSLVSQGVAVFAPSGRQARWNWDLSLNPTLPIDLDVDMGLGEALLDLRNLNIQNVDLNLGLGSTKVWLRGQGGMNLRIQGGIGETIVYVPAGAAVRLRTDTGIATTSVPDSYQQRDDTYTSPSYQQVQAGEAIEIFVNQGIGRFVLIEE
jgi:hypothetical protein